MPYGSACINEYKDIPHIAMYRLDINWLAQLELPILWTFPSCKGNQIEWVHFIKMKHSQGKLHEHITFYYTLNKEITLLQARVNSSKQVQHWMLKHCSCQLYMQLTVSSYHVGVQVFAESFKGIAHDS